MATKKTEQSFDTRPIGTSAPHEGPVTEFAGDNGHGRKLASELAAKLQAENPDFDPNNPSGYAGII